MENREKLADFVSRVLEERYGEAAGELLGEVWLRIGDTGREITKELVLGVARHVRADLARRDADVFGRRWPRPPVRARGLPRE